MQIRRVTGLLFLSSNFTSLPAKSSIPKDTDCVCKIHRGHHIAIKALGMAWAMLRRVKIWQGMSCLTPGATRAVHGHRLARSEANLLCKLQRRWHLLSCGVTSWNHIYALQRRIQQILRVRHLQEASKLPFVE